MEGQCLYLLVVLVVRSAPRVCAACALVCEKLPCSKSSYSHQDGTRHACSRESSQLPGLVGGVRGCAIICKKDHRPQQPVPRSSTPRRPIDHKSKYI